MVAGKDEVNLILITYLCMESCGLRYGSRQG